MGAQWEPILHRDGYQVRLVDGTNSGGIGHLGPFAVNWSDDDGFKIVPLDTFYQSGDGAMWTSRKQGRGSRWVRMNHDD